MSYLKLAEHYDKCFKEYGDTHLGGDDFDADEDFI